MELETVHRVAHTDSAGIVAFDEPALMGKKYFFTVASHGYEFPADGFGFHGVQLDVKPGGEAKLKIKRINIAERLYRITGEGIYRDSVLAGRKPPIKNPLLNAQVVGQDSVMAAVYRTRRGFSGATPAGSVIRWELRYHRRDRRPPREGGARSGGRH